MTLPMSRHGRASRYPLRSHNIKTEMTQDCKLCIFGSRLLGHGLTHLLGKRWSKITIEQVQPHLEGLDLRVVGGLIKRGYTDHDIDVVGYKKDVSKLVMRLTSQKINNLVHYCGPVSGTHSYLPALLYGLLVTFLGNKIYL